MSLWLTTKASQIGLTCTWEEKITSDPNLLPTSALELGDSLFFSFLRSSILAKQWHFGAWEGTERGKGFLKMSKYFIAVVSKLCHSFINQPTFYKKVSTNKLFPLPCSPPQMQNEACPFGENWPKNLKILVVLSKLWKHFHFPPNFDNETKRRSVFA